jgi:hypothetical protein
MVLLLVPIFDSGVDLKILVPRLPGVLLGAPFFDLRFDFKVLVATVPVVKFGGFKEAVVLTSKIKNNVVVSRTF